MRKIYKLYIGIMLSAIAVACSDKLDSDKYFMHLIRYSQLIPK